MAKPTESTEWAGHVDALVTATDSARWNYGWTTPSNSPTGVGEKPNLNQQNYWQNAVYKWLDYLEATTDTNVTNIGTNTTNITALERPVGSLEQSFLTEAQFNAQPGHSTAKWVLCDGRSVVGSAYETLTTLSNVPDVSGRVLRSAGGGAAALKSTQANQMGTHVHTLAHTHTLSTAWAQYYAAEITGTSYNTAWRAITSGSTSTAWNVEIAIGATSVSESAATGTIASGIALGGSTDAASTTNTGSITTGSSETRMDNITVNTFIKIN